eukprot:TRINITY_DN1857_c0_g1_i4.p1 TRINITY_DN1857_c0_g1~~TRINITY_DN1857_c0_g1_i4.p1  ORF type:complete len:263 (-),score=30.88 TRINITY_DN1857_c0_g1_i4:215-1003(-)
MDALRFGPSPLLGGGSIGRLAGLSPSPDTPLVLPPLRVPRPADPTVSNDGRAAPLTGASQAHCSAPPVGQRALPMLPPLPPLPPLRSLSPARRDVPASRDVKPPHWTSAPVAQRPLTQVTWHIEQVTPPHSAAATPIMAPMVGLAAGPPLTLHPPRGGLDGDLSMHLLRATPSSPWTGPAVAHVPSTAAQAPNAVTNAGNDAVGDGHPPLPRPYMCPFPGCNSASRYRSNAKAHDGTYVHSASAPFFAACPGVASASSGRRQ